MPQTKNKPVRVDGKLRSQEDIEPAVFRSKVDGYMAVMKSYRKVDNELKVGKRLDFSPNGYYETKDPDEIEFLKKNSQKSKPFSKIWLVREAQLKEEQTNKEDEQ